MLECFRPFRRDAAAETEKDKRRRVNGGRQDTGGSGAIHAFISRIVRMQSLVTYMQGIKERLQQEKKKSQGGFAAAGSHTHLSTHL